MRPSGAAFNAVYDALTGVPLRGLVALWEEADPYTPAGELFRRQLAFELERRFRKTDGAFLISPAYASSAGLSEDRACCE